MNLNGGRRYVEPERRFGSSVKEVYVFSRFVNNFTRLVPMNYNRRYHGCCSHAGGVFVCGGKDGRWPTCCEKFNVEENKWKLVAKMIDARCLFKVGSCGNFLQLSIDFSKIFCKIEQKH